MAEALKKDPRGERPGVWIDETAARAARRALGASVVLLSWTCSGEIGGACYEAKLDDGTTADVEVSADRSAVVITREGDPRGVRFVCACGEVLASSAASGVSRTESNELSPLHGIRPAGAFVACSNCLGPDTVRRAG